MTNENTADNAPQENYLVRGFIPTGETVFATALIDNPRFEKTVADDYRLARKSDGTLVLQGLFCWTEGFNRAGGEWRDIPTVDLAAEADQASPTSSP